MEYKNWGEGRVFWAAFSFGNIATIVSTVIGVAMGADQPSILELLAVYTSFGSTFLFVLQRRQCYLWGAVSTLLYAELFRRYQLPASGAVQVYLLGALGYGYWRWGPDGNTKRVTWVDSPQTWLLYAIATGVAWTGASFISRLLGSPLSFWDGSILAISILAQWLLDNKKIETWMVWLCLNAIAIPLYWEAGLSLVTVQYVFFAINALWGLYEWGKSMRIAPKYGRGS